MTRLWLVRHGPTHARVMVGWTDMDADLSDRAALDRLSAALPHAPVVSSDLTRAVETARAIAGPRPLLPPDPSLREIHFGEWEGLSFAEAEARDSALIRTFWEEPGEVRAPGGESWNALCARVHAGADRLSDGLPDLVIVAHFGAILSLVQRARGQTAREAMAQKIEPLSLTELHRDAAGWQVARVNDPLTR